MEALLLLLDREPSERLPLADDRLLPVREDLEDRARSRTASAR